MTEPTPRVRWHEGHETPVAGEPASHHCCPKCAQDIHFYPLGHCNHDADPLGCGHCADCDLRYESEDDLATLQNLASELLDLAGLHPDGSASPAPIRHIEDATIRLGLAAPSLDNPDIAVELARALTACSRSPGGILPPQKLEERTQIAEMADRTASAAIKARIDADATGEDTALLTQWFDDEKIRLARVLKSEARCLRHQLPSEYLIS